MTDTANTVSATVTTLPPTSTDSIVVTYYARFNANNDLLGFYNDEVYAKGVGIPKDATKITYDQWQNYINNQGQLKWNGTDFVSYTPTLTINDLLNYSSAKRRKVEENGIYLNTIPVATDRASQQMVTQTISSLALVPNLTIDWKNPDGSFTELTGDDVKAFGAYIAIYVAQTFSLQKTVTEGINAKTLKSYSDIDQVYSQIKSEYSTKSS